MVETFYNKVENLLVSNKKFLDSDGVLNKSKINDLALKLDEELISLLIDNDETRNKFFKKIKDIYVFNLNDFIYFISDKNFLSNSYTKYKNKIGLSIGGSMLNEVGDVVLNFPFKDCILEGGQDKEDSKRDEIFYNEILAPDEIDRLLDNKAFTNFKKFTSDGEKELDSFNRNETGTIKDNLIIKGNNLIALHSLKKEFSGKVKLIYIDPPYYFKNKIDDTFAYNSNFKLSTWLTFMKNRLEVAKKLLREDGIIFIQINDEGHAYLKILMDEIFDNNFVNSISVKMSDLSGPKMAHLSKKFPKLKENILVYKKKNINLNKITELRSNWDNEYKNYLENFEEEDYNFVANFDFEKDSIDELNNKLKKVKLIPLNDKLNELDLSGFKKIEKDKAIFDFCIENSFRIARTSNSSSLKKILDNIIDKYNQKIIAVKSPSNNVALCITTYDKNSKDPRVQIVFSKDTLEIPLGDLWLDINTSGLHTEGGVKLENGKKPEKLLNYIIKSSTQKGDIVMDYHLGSGTTCAVAHKMGRQYIGVEQLDYGNNDSIFRLNTVITGDQSGISKAINYKGGGEFVYFELKKWNEEAKEKIISCKSLEEMKKLFDELYSKYFLNYNLEIKNFKDKTLKEDEFKNMSLDEQKKLFCDMLDKNQMYVNYNEIEDKKYDISKEEIELNRDFYSNK